jgi:hypothetical protein
MFMAVESFFGVLYAGFAGAVMFGKINRILSKAKVVWSDPIVVRYGSGVDIENKDNDDGKKGSMKAGILKNNTTSSKEDEEDDDDDTQLPCPILEFRVVNQWYDRQGAELANASVTVWASSLAEFAPDSVRAAANLPRLVEKRKSPNSGHRKNLIGKAFNTVANKVEKGVGTAFTVGKNVASTGKNVASSVASTGKNVASSVASTSKTVASSVASSGKTVASSVATNVNTVGKTMASSVTSSLKRASPKIESDSTAGSDKEERKRRGRVSTAISSMTHSILRTSPKGGGGGDYSTSLSDEEGGASPPNFDDSIRIDTALPPPLTVEQAREAGRAEILQDLSRMTGPSKHLVVAEDPTNSGLIPQLIYSKLDIETDSHPFFKRIWIIRHRLDATSPLLSAEAHDMIQANGGFWPTELNDYKSVRKHLKFNEMMVTLSGTDHITGNTVYSHKAYDYVDVNIGWRFATALVVDPKTQALGVDLSLVNDVLEQHGGGAEPFRNVIEGDAAALEDSGIVRQEEDNSTQESMDKKSD